MKLDQVSVVIRPRNSWEALDFGLLMARRWWWPLLRVWLVITLPVFLLLNGLAWYLDDFTLACLFFWWLLPIFERSQLQLLSQAVFGYEPRLGELLRGFARVALRQFLSSLTFRRLSPYRSADLPVVQLEGLGGSKRAERLAVLHRNEYGAAIWATLCGSLCVSLCIVGMIMLLGFLLPSSWWLGLDLLSNGPGVLLLNLIFYIAEALVAPFYVGAGFGIYLNRRTRLESWDLDIEFRRMVESRQEKNNASLPVIALLCFGLATALFDPAPTFADAVGDEVSTNEEGAGQAAPSEGEQVEQALQKIYSEPPFIETRISKKPSFMLEDNDEEEQVEEDLDDPEIDSVWIDLLDKGIKYLAGAVEILFWAAALALIALLVYRYRHWTSRFGLAAKKAERTSATTLFGLDLRADTLPEHVADEALGLWQQGRAREAISLLYRASLINLSQRFPIQFRRGDTEGDCLRRVQDASSEDHSHHFQHLTLAWQQLAYRHRLPEEGQFTQLCSRWRHLFPLAEAGNER